MEKDITVCVEGEQIMLKISQTEDYQGIHKETHVSISISNDKITCNTSITINEQHKNFKKDVNDEIECINKVRYITLKKIMHCLFKVCKKKMMKLIKIKIKIKNNDDDINKEKL